LIILLWFRLYLNLFPSLFGLKMSLGHAEQQ
jgi:hypothetical protein